MNLIAKKALCVALAAYLTAGSAAALNAGNVSNITVPFAVKAEAADVVNSGSCGKNLTWSLDSDGVLTISGTGDMTDYSWNDSYAPWKDANVKSVVIPDGVTRIGSIAFYDCSGLTSVTIGNGVASIGNSAFYNTAFYNDANNWENGVLYIGNYLIKSSGEISGKYAVKSGTKVIADRAFEDCSGLTSITIPDSVTSIGNYTFYGCTGLTSVTIPDSVTSIGYDAFMHCTGLTSVTIPDSVTSIGSSARIIGAGNPATRLYTLSPSVFFIHLIKYGLSKKLLKCFSPTHWLAKIPRAGE